MPDPAKYVFLGPLVGAGARVLFAPSTTRWVARSWTLVSGIGLDQFDLVDHRRPDPDLTSAATLSAGFNRFLRGMLLIFLFAGIGNARRRSSRCR